MYKILYEMKNTMLNNDSKKGFKKQKQMEIFHFNPSKYNIENEMITSGNKITRFEM